MQAIMQSQQAWHIAQQSASPLVQVKHTPILVSVHSHLHMVKQQLHITMPFIMQQQLHMLPASILHMFCKVAAATSSSQVQVILKPSLVFSIFIVQRGTMHICIAPGIDDGIVEPCIGMPIAPIGLIMLLSIIIMLAIAVKLPFFCDLTHPSFLTGAVCAIRRRRTFRTGGESGPLARPVSIAPN
jgi:hypothetical protein